MRFAEDILQVTMARYLSKVEAAGYAMTYAADQNAARRGRTAAPLARLMGMRAGETDLRIYLEGGRVILVEVKAAGGRLSKSQSERHDDLGALGHEVIVVTANDPQSALDDLRSALLFAGVQWAGRETRSLSEDAVADVMEVIGTKKNRGSLAKLADRPQIETSNGET